MDWIAMIPEQNWDNFLVLLCALSVSFIGNFINNRFAAQRTHNLTKLFNESIGRANLVFVSYYATLTFLVAGSNNGKRLMITLIFISAFMWIGGLYITEHALLTRIKTHECQIEKRNPNLCKYEVTFRELFGISLWNLLLFAAGFVLAFCISFSPVACGIKCLEAK